MAIDAASNAGPGAVLAARGLGKTYRMGDVDVAALHDVDLLLRDGEFVVLLGPSRSGKSTRMNTLGALEAVSAGARG